MKALRTVLLLLGTGMVVALVGCGGDKGSSGTTLPPENTRPPVSDVVEQGTILNECARLAGKYTCTLTPEETANGQRKNTFEIRERTTKRGVRIIKLKNADYIADGDVHERVEKSERQRDEEKRFQKNHRDSRRDRDEDEDYYYSKVRYSVSCQGSTVTIHAVGSERQKAVLTIAKLGKNTLTLTVDSYANGIGNYEMRTCTRM